MNDATPRKWRHLVIDLETLATCPRAIVIELGAVFVDPQIRACGPALEVQVAPFGGDQDARTLDHGTLKWWVDRMGEGHEIPGLRGGVPLGVMVDTFLEFYHANAADDCHVWCQGLDFDVAILRDVLAEYGYAEPWRYYNARCLRTLARSLGYRRRGAKNPHRALDDALAEAGDLIEMHEILETNKEALQSWTSQI